MNGETKQIMINREENRLIHIVKTQIKMRIWWRDRVKKLLENKNAEAVLLCTPLHGNVGDQALAIADFKFLETCGINPKKVLEIPTAILEGLSNKQIKKIVNDRIIFLHAGGFIGNTWQQEERQFHRCIKLCSENNIIILPQTITFTNDNKGKADKKKTKKIFRACKDLTICVREKKSVGVACELVGKENVLCVPDMVIGFISNGKEVINRHNECLLCMRQDIEKLISDDVVRKIKEEVSSLGFRIKYTDTVVKGYVYPEEREQIVKQKMEEFSSAKLVITDRLHGMLFAAVTGTPCLFFNNSNGKVKNVYEWIKDLGYIKPIENLDNVKKNIEIVLSNRNSVFYNEDYRTKYKRLIEMVAKKYMDNNRSVKG